MANRMKQSIISQFERLLENNKFMILCTGIVIFYAAAYFFPTSYWYELNRVRIQDAKASEPILMAVDRNINREFIGHWAVIVRRMNSGTGDIVCVDGGTTNYKTDAKLPEHLTLGWWSGGTCNTLGEGFYMVTTIVHIDVPNILQPKRVINESNIFKVSL